MWSAINGVFNAGVDAWLWALRSLPPFVHLCALALPAAVLALVVYRYASNQAGIHAVKDKLKAYLLELRLFKDDLPVTLRAQGQILRHSVAYMGYALVPLSIMIAPIVLLLIQIESRYAFRPLHPDETTLVEVALQAGAPPGELEATLLLPSGLVCETPALRIEDERKVLWRVRARRPGEYDMRIRIGDQEVAKKVLVASAGAPSPAIYRTNDVRTLAYPLERPLPPESIVSSVHLTYPRSLGEFAGLSSASWTWFLATLVFGYALRGLFGVTF